ncbi:MAG: NADH-quinone oxidoreductase subunit D, partial [Methanobacteriota archaeon]
MPEFWINMGPQHPMTHGLWNMKVKVDGETITDAKPEIGYLHRGYEKIMEVREFQKNVVLTDRLCYVSSITWSHAYCLAVEKMMGIETPERGQWIRVIALELQRVASHLMWLASYGPDLGLLTGLLWCLRERELFLDLIQLMSGARMNQNYPRVGGVRNDLPENFEAMCKRSIEHFLEKVKNEYPQIFQESKVFRMRTEGVGTISAADAINWGVTGPNLRACGVNVDLRRLDPYETYEEIDFEPQVWHDGGAGDSYARFECRFNELNESCKIILQALEKMPKTGPYRVKPPRRAEGEGYAKTEDSRGEALFFVIGDGDDRPYRVKIRSPVFTCASGRWTSECAARPEPVRGVQGPGRGDPLDRPTTHLCFVRPHSPVARARGLRWFQSDRLDRDVAHRRDGRRALGHGDQPLHDHVGRTEVVQPPPRPVRYHDLRLV